MGVTIIFAHSEFFENFQIWYVKFFWAKIILATNRLVPCVAKWRPSEMKNLLIAWPLLEKVEFSQISTSELLKKKYWSNTLHWLIFWFKFWSFTEKKGKEMINLANWQWFLSFWQKLSTFWMKTSYVICKYMNKYTINHSLYLIPDICLPFLTLSNWCIYIQHNSVGNCLFLYIGYVSCIKWVLSLLPLIVMNVLIVRYTFLLTMGIWNPFREWQISIGDLHIWSITCFCVLRHFIDTV